MSGVMAINRDFTQEGPRWSPMLVLSIFLHGALFSALFFVPGNSRSGLKINEEVYEVTLVESPKASPSMDTASASSPQNASTHTTSSDNKQAKRIYTPSRQDNKVKIAKKTVKKSPVKPKRTEPTSDQLLEKAISRIEKKVKAEKSTDHLAKAIAAIDKKVSSSKEGAPGGGSQAGNLAIKFYQMELDRLIKSQWSYPGAIDNRRKPEAVVLVKVRRDGTVLDTGFIKKSGNNIFDESVLKAIEKAKPLPPLPEGYEKDYEEIEIVFILKDLE